MTDLEMLNPCYPIAPTTANLFLSNEENEIRKNLPTAVQNMIQRLYVTGVCESVPDITRTVNHSLKVRIPESVISYIVNENISKWYEKRIAYLDELNDRYLNTQIKLEKSPVDERHYNLLTKLEMLASLKAEEIADQGDVDVDELIKLSKATSTIVNDLRNIPSLEEVQKRSAEAEGKVVETAKIILTRVLEYADNNKLDKVDSTMNRLEKHTKEKIADGAE
jgi:hypothetical protein